ncbi:MAG: decaprenyl-phosphate phosphoribosyltransferase [Patescibacteria group bacterium]|nr:MAG: decaprenyl-phosphate phosphoribosyltransferase [Patescibacteria group bacterium]
MIYLFYQLIRTARPRQWLKNLSLFAAPVFAGRLFERDTFSLTLYAFVSFCLLSSASYFVNDIIDAPKDKLHPIKKNRPIASGRLSPLLALIVALLFASTSLFIGFRIVGTYFGFSLVFYMILQASYSLYFRNVIIMDSLVVATGFVLRVFAGGLASYTSISSWLALTTIGISLLLAFGKRRSEKTILAKYHLPQEEIETRKTLRHYPDNLLDSMISMSAAYTIITYSLFVFQISPSGANDTLLRILPSILKSPKWMMLTIPLVIYGVARYLYVIYEKGEAESPERVLLSDKPLLFIVIFWGILTMFFVYLVPDF